MRASIYLVLGTSLAFAAGYLVLRSKGIAATQPAMTRTLADGQQRREVDRLAPSVRESASTPTQETLTGKNDPIGRLADAEGQLDRSMVGLPFALSKSVTEACKERGDCEDLEIFLVKMAAEPRNPDWAPRMERYIVQSIQREEDGALRIRALECRTTRCAIEVASEAQMGIQKSWKFDGELRLEGASGYGRELERDTAILTKVMVHTWRSKDAPYDDD